MIVRMIPLWMALTAAATCIAAEPSQTLRGRIAAIDAGIRTITVRSADGIEHTFHWAADTAVHGAKAGASDALAGLSRGAEVAVHYIGETPRRVAIEVDKLGSDGLRVLDGTVSRADHAAKSVVLKSAAGAEATFQLADHAAAESAKAIHSGAKMTVYYVEEGGRGVVHYFESK